MAVIEMLEMDCMDLMKQQEDGAFDLAIVDPPYGIDVTKENMGSRKRAKQDNMKSWDSAVPTQDYFKELFRVSTNTIIWGGNYFDLPCNRHFAICDKGETMYGRSFAECEYAWIRSGGTRIFKGSPRDTFRIHPTQKPVKLYEWLLMHYAKPGDRILDTHVGSGSSAIACHYAEHDFVGCELDPHYFRAAKQRFKDETSQQALDL